MLWNVETPDNPEKDLTLMKIRTFSMQVSVAVLLMTFVPSAIAPAYAEGQTRAEKKAAKKEAKYAKKRAHIDSMAKEALDHVLSESPGARKMFENAVGYAAFDNWHTALAISGGSGKGVAMKKETGDKTYMKMKTLGLKFGMGVQKCQVVFMFQNENRYRQFIENGWAIESGAEAAAGKKGAAVQTQWVNGVAMWQITEAGLMAAIDLSGTKYYPVKKWDE